MHRDALPNPMLVPSAALDSQSRSRRAALLLVVAAMVVLGLAYRTTLGSMVEIWSRSETFAHGFIVPLISLWLVWRQRAAVAGAVVKPWYLALVAVGLVGFGWLLGELAEVNALRHFAFVGMLVLAIPAIAGLRIARQLAFPLAFLAFAVPFGEFMLPRLMQWTATFTVTALQLTGIPVYREGLRFVIPSGSWSVVEACSGVRYLIASVMVGTLFAYLNYRSPWRRIAFVAVAIAVPLVANWLRAYMIVLLGHLSGNRIAVGVDHLIYGWAFFGFVMLLMFWIGARWREDLAPAAQATRPAAANTDVTMPPSATPSSVAVATVLFLLAALAPLAASRLLEAGPHTNPPALGALPPLAGWTEVEVPAGAWRPRYLQPAATREQGFAKDGRRVTIYVAYYRNQSAGSKLVSSENVLVPSDDKRWSIAASANLSPGAASAPPEVLAADIVGERGERLRAWQWYWVNGQWTASPVRAKALLALSRLTGGGDDSASVVIWTPRGSEPDALRGADALLGDFATAAAASLSSHLRATAGSR